MAKNNNKNQEESNDGLALIIGGLFVLALVFATYSYFNRGSTPEKEFQNEIGASLEEVNQAVNEVEDETNSLGERIRELFNAQSQGELNGEGASTENIDDEENQDEMDSIDENGTTRADGSPKVLIDNENGAVLGTWTANDYQDGDITGNSYVVKGGDTLWEIAQAKYGNGADWTRILDANSESIGQLPNGQQALIVVGQTLVLP